MLRTQEMIKEAITTLKERNGSSVPAIKKAMSKHTLPAGWEKVLNLQLKKLSDSKKLVKVREASACRPQPNYGSTSHVARQPCQRASSARWCFFAVSSRLFSEHSPSALHENVAPATELTSA